MRWGKSLLIGIDTPTNLPFCSVGPVEGTKLPRMTPIAMARKIQRARKRSSQPSALNAETFVGPQAPLEGRWLSVSYEPLTASLVPDGGVWDFHSSAGFGGGAEARGAASVFGSEDMIMPWLRDLQIRCAARVMLPGKSGARFGAPSNS